MQAQASAAGTVISAVMFGALAGSGTLPLSRADWRIRDLRGRKGAEASLKGLLQRASTPRPDRHGRDRDACAKEAPERSERVRQTFPEETRCHARRGAARCSGFQDRGYARLYLDPPRADRESRPRCRRITSSPTKPGVFSPCGCATRDVIRVADLKTRRSRFEPCARKCGRSRTSRCTSSSSSSRAWTSSPAVLPRFLARPLKRLAGASGSRQQAQRRHARQDDQRQRLLPAAPACLVRPFRRHTSRWHEEQALIGRWLGLDRRGGEAGRGPGARIALCGRLIRATARRTSAAKAIS